jgi:choline-glycine betaine transporter
MSVGKTDQVEINDHEMRDQSSSGEPAQDSNDSSSKPIQSYDTRSQSGSTIAGVSAMRLARSRLGGCAAVAINPVSTVFALIILAGLVIFSALAGTEGSSQIQAFVFYGTADSMALAGQLSSFFLVSVAFWLIFMLYIAIMHGDKKLGKADDVPEYSNATYFALIFTAGAAMGIYFYGVAEGLGNQGPSANRFARSPYLTQNERDTYAMDLSIFNWGVNTFAPYSLVGVLIGYQHFARGLPMTTRSLFYDFLGEYTWGWLGDLIDGYSIVSVMSGLLASLGISVQSLIAGFQALGWMDEQMDDHEIKVAQSIIVAVIIFFATISVATGINTGIKHLATFAMVGSTSLWLMVFALENKPYVLNLLTQTFGNYITSLVPFSFHSDAFAQLLPGEGAQLDQSTVAKEWWVTFYPLFYFCWSMSWSPFVGTFYAKVSKGRTVRECITYTLLVSFSYYILWFVLFSGGGIRMQRRALELEQLGDLKFNDTAYFAIPGRTHCFKPPLEPVEYILDGTSYTYVNREPDVTSVCLYDSDSAKAWFDYLRQFSTIGYGLCVLSVVCMFFFFITTSDSTSLVFDYLSSNGDEQHTWLQRCIWSLLQAALTIMLIWGGEAGSALSTAQALCIIASIPNMVMLNLACANLLYSFRSLEGDESKNFRMPMYGGIFDIFEFACSLGKMDPGRGAPAKPSGAVWSTFALSLFAPFYIMHRINREEPNRIAITAFTALCWVGWISCMAAQSWAVAFMFYVWLTLTIAATRYAIRAARGIRGNLLEDVFATFIMYPNVLSQVLFQNVDAAVPIYAHFEETTCEQSHSVAEIDTPDLESVPLETAVSI